MYNPDFTRGTLQSLIRRRDRYEYSVLELPHLRDHYLNSLCEKINGNSFEFDIFKCIRVGNFRAYQPTQLGDTLVLRRLNKLIRSAYGLQQADRTAIIKQAKTLFSENCPKYVYKLDIQKFFESIRRDSILSQIRNDGILSPISVSLLSTLFEGVRSQAKFGLPRGLAISTTLSELYLKALDKLIPRLPGVYYYARYVDDILIFSSAPIDNISKIISEHLPQGMRLNGEKFQSYYFGCDCYPRCRCGTPECQCAQKCKCSINVKHEVEYLGYKLEVSKALQGKPEKPVQVRIGIAERKLKRIKSRIVTALLSHVKDNDASLLRLRIRFLTENHRINTPANRGKLHSGVRYNYPLITDTADLTQLNEFLRKQVFAKAGSYGLRLHSALSLSEKKSIANLCFVGGFKKPRSRALSHQAIKYIRKCW